MVWTLDPTLPLEDHLIIDQLIANGDFVEVVACPTVWTPAFGHQRRDKGIWRVAIDDETLQAWTRNLREAAKLPLYPGYAAAVSETLAECEAALRARRGAIAARNRREWEPWTPEAFRASVEALCGKAWPKGRQTWFRCIFHDDDDPSLEVDFENMIWHCWGCEAKGGYVEWDKRTKGFHRGNDAGKQNRGTP